MHTNSLSDALYRQERSYDAALDKVLAAVENDQPTYESALQLREAIYLVGRLRRLVNDGIPVAKIHDAFGAPGDFGYDTPIGDALSKLYRGEQ